MKKTLAVILLLAVSLFLLNGCYTMTHVVGQGAQSNLTETARQWYVLWGLVPLNDVSSKSMAGGATSYTVKTEITPLDFLINIFTGFVTVYSMSVEVKK
ncbi:MAG: hypothetical protein HYW57_02565 [Ignavibacteriales bacterium]|nr:hypothetical protein [Ignavibacteriales bacterium]